MTKRVLKIVERISAVTARNEAPVVGHDYFVPCVNYKGTWIPVFDNLHTDKEVAPHIGAHYHYDWRFIGESCAWHAFGVTLKNSEVPSILQVGKIYDIELNENRNVIRWMRKKCVRLVAGFPLYFPPTSSDDTDIRIQAITFKVEMLCEGKRIDPRNPVCPHRGIALGGQIPDVDGCITCPGHGLRWNLETGKLVPRYSAAEEEACWHQADKAIVRIPIAQEYANANS